MSEPQTFLDGRVTLYAGDNGPPLDGLADASVDAVVTDPPYHLTSIVRRFSAPDAAPPKAGATGVYARGTKGFMGQTWDGGDIAFQPAFWAKVFRVLKPGGHVVAFSGTRTYHRMACAIEDAGFEIRDMTAWLYGSGFPKSLDVAKAMDKADCVWRGRAKSANVAMAGANYERGDKGEPVSPDAIAWDGWGTALKPALEPICLARKPLIGTVAANVMAHGTGALNIAGCRIAGADAAARDYTVTRLKPGATLEKTGGAWRPEDGDVYHGRTKDGRHPANVLHDGSAAVSAAFPGASRSNPHPRRNSDFQSVAKGKDRAHVSHGHTDAGSAARFFYSAKADADDRIGSKHPTVKPVDLMRWLCRLITPPGGVVLDPFAGTGTTGEAAFREGFAAILMEREAAYCADIARRMALVREGPAIRAAVSAAARGEPAAAIGPLFETAPAGGAEA